MSKMNEKKVGNRTTAIVLGIISIVLAVAIVGAVTNYTSVIVAKDNTNAVLANQNSQIQTWLNGNKTLLASLTEQRDQLQNQIKITTNTQAYKTSIQNQVNPNQTSITNLAGDCCQLLHDSNQQIAMSPPQSIEPSPCSPVS